MKTLLISLAMVILYITNIDAIEYTSIKAGNHLFIYKSQDVVISKYHINDSILLSFSKDEVEKALFAGSYETSAEYIDYNTWWSKKQTTTITKELKREEKSNTVRCINHPPVKSDWEINWLAFVFWIVLSTGAYILGKTLKTKLLTIWQKIIIVIEGAILSIPIGFLLNIVITRGTIWSSFGYALIILIGVGVIKVVNLWQNTNPYNEERQKKFHMISGIVLIIGSILTAIIWLWHKHTDATPVSIALYCIFVPLMVGYIKKKSK